MQQTQYTFKENFSYRHKNPYHDRLVDFEDFILRDHEPEAMNGKWNTEVFKREGELNVEIGTGYGHFMLDYCESHPLVNFVGMDYRFKRSFQLAKKLGRLQNKNFRYLRARGERIAYIFGEAEVDNLYYFFPDPWPKSRHHKKRLFQLPFLEEAAKAIKPGGKFYIKTDHDGYAKWMKDIIDSEEAKKLFKINLATFDLREESPEHFLASFSTKFEKIFLDKGIKIKAFELERLCP